MLTLDELKEAVAEFFRLNPNPILPMETARVIRAARQVVEEADEEKELLDTKLTAEICEKLGMVKRATGYYVTECRLIRVDIPRGVVEGYVWDVKLTIRHLLAAACLAGVTVDLGRLAK
jgi:hypothetical protein